MGVADRQHAHWRDPPPARPPRNPPRVLHVGVGVEVPVIDLAGSDAAVASEVASACEEWGFFQVVNHGVDEA